MQIENGIKRYPGTKGNERCDRPAMTSVFIEYNRASEKALAIGGIRLVSPKQARIPDTCV